MNKHIILGVLTLLTVTACQSNSYAQSSLIHHWALEEGSSSVVLDSATPRFKATNTAGRGLVENFCVDGTCVYFNGETSRIDLGKLNIRSNAFTISLWALPNSFNEYADNRLISKSSGTAENDHDWMISTIETSNGIGLRFRLKTDGTTSTLIDSTADVTLNQWMHVVVVYDGQNMKIFKDGQLRATQAKSGIVSQSNKQVYLGQNFNGYGRFHGRMDDIRIYKEAFSDAQVNDLYVAYYEPGCGNGIVETNEQCDDGNLTDQDGCSASCIIDAGYTCSGVPSVCNPITACNDGIDNDNDGAIDFGNDFSCTSAVDVNETFPKAQCQDGIDNDNDGFIDLDDEGCLHAQDNSEESDSGTPSWSEGRDANGNLLVYAGPDYGTYVFTEEEAQTHRAGGSWSLNCPANTFCNQIIWDVHFDNYLSNGAGDYDVFHFNENARADNVLIKNAIIQNGWQCNTGVWSNEHGASCPAGLQNTGHVDVLQVWKGPAEHGGYFVVQDSALKNSDDGQLLHMTDPDLLANGQPDPQGPGGVVFQNVIFDQEGNFTQDCIQRGGGWECGGNYIQIKGHQSNLGSLQSPHGWGDIWLINVSNPKSINFRLEEDPGNIIIIGGSGGAANTWPGPLANPAFQGPGDNACDGLNGVLMPLSGYHSTNSVGFIYCYDSIEQALADGHSEPPFIRLSESGWANN